MLSILKRNGSLAMATGLAQQGIALVQFVLTARLLAPADLGQWAMYLTLIALADMARHPVAQTQHHDGLQPAHR